MPIALCCELLTRKMRRPDAPSVPCSGCTPSAGEPKCCSNRVLRTSMKPVPLQPGGASFEMNEVLSDLYGATRRNINRFDSTSLLGQNVALHLHRFQNQQHVAHLHLLPGLCVYPYDQAGNRAANDLGIGIEVRLAGGGKDFRLNAGADGCGRIDFSFIRDFNIDFVGFVCNYDLELQTASFVTSANQCEPRKKHSSRRHGEQRVRLSVFFCGSAPLW